MIPLRDSQPSHSTPVVTGLLILLNSVIFLYEVSLDPFSRNHFIESFGMTPARFQPLTLVSSMFLHGGWMHLIGNMWFLWIFGDNIEDTLGRRRFLLFYFLCGIAAALTHFVFNSDSRVPTIGASGAIAGVMGGYVIKFPHSRIVTLIPVFIFFTTVEISAYLMLLYWLAIQIFFGVGGLAQADVNRGGVAWFAHAGGFLAGALLIKLLPTRKPYWTHRELYW